MRLDQYLFQNGMAESRERGHALVMEGLVYLDGAKAEKPGQQVPDGAGVELRGTGLTYVSRGGLKLEKAMQVFPVSPKGLVCMDVGASTGGFTDCMLQNGAAKVYAVDVGYGQLAWKLRCDERVVVMERTNIRAVRPDILPEVIQFFSVDVSFISLGLVLPVLGGLVAGGAAGVCLIKPQFEAGKDKVGKKGVVRDITVHREVIAHCFDYALRSGFTIKGLDFSPVKGPKGNIEYLLYIEKGDGLQPVVRDNIDEVCALAHQALS